MSSSIAADGQTLNLRFIDTTVRIASPTAAPLAWLAEFLTPEFDLAHEANADVAIQFDDAGADYDALHRLGPIENADPVHGFALDTQMVPLTPWRSGSSSKGDAVYLEPDLGVFYRVQADRRSLTVAAAAGNVWGRIALMRLVREIAQSRAMAAGAVAFHAAALGRNGRVLAIAGPKRAGKTSLLLHLLHVTGASLVASDRLCLVNGDSGIAARGIPTVIKIRPGSVDLFAAALASLSDRPHRACLSGVERAEDDLLARTQAHRPDPRRVLNPDQLTGALGIDRLGQGALAAVIFPRVDPENAAGLTLARMDPAIAFDAYERSLFRAGQDWLSRSVLLDDAGQLRAKDAALGDFGRQLAATVPCYQCVLGAGAFEDAAPPSVVAKLLATDDRRAAAGAA
jgi:hypothetical protein